LLGEGKEKDDADQRRKGTRHSFFVEKGRGINWESVSQKKILEDVSGKS